MRFWGLDKDLKRNIIKRGVWETPLKPLETSLDEKDLFDDSLLGEEKNNQIHGSCNDEF